MVVVRGVWFLMARYVVELAVSKLQALWQVSYFGWEHFGLVMLIFLGFEQLLNLSWSPVAVNAFVREQERVSLQLRSQEHGVVHITMPVQLLQHIELALESFVEWLNFVSLLDERGVDWGFWILIFVVLLHCVILLQIPIIVDVVWNWELRYRSCKQVK